MIRPVLVLLRKELLDVVRDRRAVLLSLVLPVLLYPGLLAVMGAIATAGRAQLKNEALVVATVSPDAISLLGRRPPPPKTSYRAMSRAEAEAGLEAQEIAALVEVGPGASALLEAGRQVVVTVGFTKRFDRSTEALDRLRPVLAELNDEELGGRLRQRQLELTFVQPVKTEPVDLDFHKDLGPFIASRILPMVLLMMLLVGAVYPAVDLTAGEKERGTLETLLVSAVSPRQVMAAKYLTVSLVAVASALANLLAMGLTFSLGLSLGEQPITLSLSPGQLLVMTASLVPASLLLAGLALAVASTARTFKEGQSLMTPLMLVAMAPGILSQMPGMELSTGLAFVPLLNVALLLKAVILGTVHLSHVLITVTVVAACALLALWLAAAAFQSEVFRFAGTGSWSEMLGRRVKSVKS